MRATLQPCAVTHRVCAGNFKKKSIFFRSCLHRPGFALACAGGTKNFFLKKKHIFLESCHRRPCALPHKVVCYRTRLQSWTHRPCAITHRVYEGNFAKKKSIFLSIFLSCLHMLGSELATLKKNLIFFYFVKMFTF
jgi:hypothetical protein